jgi:hypothetical protein
MVLLAACGAGAAALGLTLATSRGRNRVHSALTRMTGRATVADRLVEHGAAARARLEPYFTAAGVAFPPAVALLAGFKQERRLELYAAAPGQAVRFVRSYPILGSSGTLGPKLREGDLQVPEGFYGIESLNPNSRFHLALRVDYPNEHDRAMARAEGREQLGGDIMIHGGSASIGCLAMGDEAAEELFVLAATVGIENVQVILSPVDFRAADLPAAVGGPAWVAELHDRLRGHVRQLAGRE